MLNSIHILASIEDRNNCYLSYLLRFVNVERRAFVKLSTSACMSFSTYHKKYREV